MPTMPPLFSEDILKGILLNETFNVLFQIWLKFAPESNWKLVSNGSGNGLVPNVKT